MRKLTLSAAFLFATTAVACSFQMGSGTRPNTPGQGGAAAAGTPAPGTPAAAPTPNPSLTGGTAAQVGRTRAQIPGKVDPTPGTPATPGTTPGTTPPAGIPVLAGTSVFGTGTADPTGWKGSLFVIPPATQKIPALQTMTPAGILFAKSLDVSRKAMTGGFPGIDATRNENFAIRWEAPLIVENEADYTFRLASEDGSILLIDGTPIIDNDGNRDQVAEKSGPVHLVKGTHVITVDYMQASGQVALQLFCKKAGGTESICPLKL